MIPLEPIAQHSAPTAYVQCGGLYSSTLAALALPTNLDPIMGNRVSAAYGRNSEHNKIFRYFVPCFGILTVLVIVLKMEKIL